MSSSAAQARALVTALGEASVLDADKWVSTFVNAFSNLNTFDALSKHMGNVPSGNKIYSGFVEQLQDDHDQEKNLSILALGSIGKSLHQFNDAGESYGFRKGTDKGACESAIQDSLTSLLPVMLRLHIDEAIKKHNEKIQQTEQDPLGDRPVVLKSLKFYGEDDEFLEEFSAIILSEAFIKNEQFLQSQDKTGSSTNSWMNELLVYEYLRNQGDLPSALDKLGRFDGTSFPKVTDSRGRLSTLQAWLDNNTAASEGITYSQVLAKMASADQAGQAPLMVLKDKDAFINSVLSQAPLPDIFFPQHDEDLTKVPAASYLTLRLPTWAQQSGKHLDLTTSLGEASQNFMRSLTYKWNAHLEGALKTTLSNAMGAFSFSPALHSVRGRNIKYPVTFEVREYGADMVKDIERLISETGKRFFNFDKNDRLWYVEGNTDVSMQELLSWDSPEQRPLLPDDAKVMVWKNGALIPRPQGRDYSGAGCFIEGTLVWTSVGEVPIEDLRENDRVLTLATSAEYGVKSDEVVANPTGGYVIFWGFNEEDVFFTAGHVFHTTTGRRAIDPIAAKRENPWLEVGQLRVGHTLFRTKDGETYEHVTIDRLHSQRKECDHVWGVHLREGLRSYHANGYLVHLNYPEITVKSIADIIKTLSPEQSVNIMRAIKELKPVFERFGAGTVEQLLARELSDDEFLRKARHKPEEDFAPQPLYFQSRSFHITAYDDQNGIDSVAEGYVVPQVDALDGVLYVDGAPVERSKILQRGFTWSRNIGELLSLGGDLWEHGMCTFGHDKDMICGDGFVCLDMDPNPSKMSKVMIRFTAASTALRQEYTVGFTPLVPKTIAPSMRVRQEVPRRAVHEIVVSRLIHEEEEEIVEYKELSVGAVEEESVVEYHVLSGSVEEVTEFKVSSAPADERSGTDKLLESTEDASLWFADQKTLDAKRELADKVEGQTPRTADTINTTQDMTWLLSYDRSPYDENDSPYNTLPYLAIVREWKSEPGAPPTMNLRIPFFDKLAKARKLATQSEEEMTYYSSGFTTGQDHKTDYWLKIDNGEAIALAADDNVDEYDEVKSYKDLTFKNAGFDETLPFLFSTITIRHHNILNTLKGRIAEFEEGKPENVGGQHWVVGEPQQAVPAEPVTRGGSQNPSITTPVIEPAKPPAQPPVSGSEPLKSLVNLGRGLGVDSELVKNTAQSYIYKAMLFHMDDNDRNNFTREAKPPTKGIGALPSGLADGLEENLREWLRKVYSVAYIANMMSQQSETDQAKMNTRFTEQDKKRLRYFWQGRGQGCLSRSTEYSQLNSIANVVAFRTLYPAVINYVQDGVAEDVVDENDKPLLQQRGGRKWAYKYFHALKAQDWVGQTASQMGSHEHTNRNPLEFHCTILSALWTEPVGSPIDGAGLAKVLTEMVYRKIKDSVLFQYTLFVKGADLATGMNDFMGPLIDILMDEQRSKEAGYDPKVRQKLLDDMMGLVSDEVKLQIKQQKLSKESANKMAAASVKASMSGLLGIKTAKDYTFKGAKSIFEFVRKLRTKPPVGETGIELGPVGENPLPEIPVREPKVPEPPAGATFGAKAVAVVGFIFSVAATAFYVYQTWDSWKRIGDMTPLERTELVATGLQALGGLAFNTFRSVQLFEHGFQGPPKQAAAAVQEAEHAAASTFENATKRRQSWINPQNERLAADPVLQRRRATAPMKLAENTAKASSVNEQVLPKRTLWQRLKDGKPQFGALEMSLRAFAIAVTIVLITVSIISAIQSWGEKSPLEKWLTVIGLIIQIVAVLIEIAVLFYAVSPFFTVGIIVIGIVFQAVCFFLQKKKEPEQTPAQKWYNNVWSSFKDTLPTPQSNRFKWSVSPEGGKIGEETTITVTARAADPAANHIKNLSKMNLYFSISGNNDGTSLLNTPGGKLEQITSGNSSPGNGQASIIFPDSFVPYTTNSILDTTPSQSTLRRITCTFGLQDAGELLKVSPGYKGNMPFLDKWLATGTEIKFVFRGKVSKWARKPDGATNEAAGVVPDWGKYRFSVEEHYTDDTGAVEEHIVEEEIVFEKRR